jgi:GntR family transcriptional regulator
MPTLPAKTGLPLYEIVRAGILQRLRTGQWSAGDRLPTESQLAEQFGVGIGTIRRAVEELVNERVLDRRARRGTTVATISEEHSFALFFSFVDLSGQAVQASSRLLSFKKERAGQDLADTLKIARGDRIARVDNLRLVDEQAVMLDRIWIPLDRFAGLTVENFSSRRGSIYGYYQEVHGVSVVRVAETLGACAADVDTADVLGVPVNYPLLSIERTAFTFSDVPVEFRLRFVNCAHCKYRNVRGLQD